MTLPEKIQKALKLFRNAIQASEDKADLVSAEDDIFEIESRIRDYLAESGQEDDDAIECAVEDAVNEVWPNMSGHWEKDPRRFAL